ncbi:nuclease-related domain-containing protein [Kineococcus sp. SYSU DK001]|uniref:nuclease-related domain-containing protein n=1 Tax=Kineococcus sp. SYSU DK001 TaxID=3383122 RepID=UPI003D7D2B1F
MGIAGGGAQEQARRATARVARLRHELSAAELREQLAAAERSEHAWSAGAEGERLVAQTLTGLDRHGWVVLHDVHWPGRRYANLDHVAIGPGGVVVVDAKKWSGDVTLDDGHLRQNGYRRDRELDGVARATAAVAALLPPRHRSATRGVLCLVDQPFRPARTRSGVRVVGRTHLVGHLRSLEETLTPGEVTDLAEFLRAQLDGERTTTAAVHVPAPRRGLPPGRPAAARRPPARRSARRFREDLLALLLALVVLFLGSMLLTHLLARIAAPLGAGA